MDGKPCDRVRDLCTKQFIGVGKNDSLELADAPAQDRAFLIPNRRMGKTRARKKANWALRAWEGIIFYIPHAMVQTGGHGTHRMQRWVFSGEPDKVTDMFFLNSRR